MRQSEWRVPILVLTIIVIGCSSRAQAQNEQLGRIIDFESAQNEVGAKDMRLDHSRHYRLWLGVGGSGAFPKTAPLSCAGGLAFQSCHTLLSTTVIHSTSVRRTVPRYTYTQIDALIGYGTNGYDLTRYGFIPDQLYLSISTGFGWYSYLTNWRRGGGRFVAPAPFDSSSIRHDSYDWGFGILIQAQASCSLFHSIGLGVTLIANLNTKHIDYGAVASVTVSYF